MGRRLVALLGLLAVAGAGGTAEECVAALRGGDAGAEARLVALGPAAFGVVAQVLEGRDPSLVKRAAARVLLEYSKHMDGVEPHGDRLARVLDDGDPRVRAAAGKLLLRAGPKNVAALERAFAGKHDDGREYAARALGRLGAPALPAIRKNLASGSSRRRGAAAQAAGHLGPLAQEFVPALLALLDDRDEEVRAAAALALGRLRAAPDQAVPLLLKGLDDAGAGSFVCAEALAAYGAAGLPRVVAALGEADGRRSDLLLLAVEELPEDAWPAFAEELRKAAPAVRAALLEALPRAPVEDLEAWRKDVHPPTRRAAVRALLLTDQAMPVALAHAQDSDRATRARVVHALAVLGGPSDHLRAALDDGDAGVRMEAACALWRRAEDGPDPLPLCLERLAQGSPEAAARIGEIGRRGRAGLEALVEAAGREGRAGAAAARSIGILLSLPQADVFDDRAAGLATAGYRESVGKALGWLASRQDTRESGANLADGRWDCDGFVVHGKGGHPGHPDCDVGVTGLALLAFLAAGHTDYAGPWRGNVQQALRFLASQQQSTGQVGDPKLAPAMVQHAIATAALCEAACVCRDAALAGAAQRALDFVAFARNPYLAWRYEPRGGENDTFITAWMMTALKLGHVAGLRIDPDAFEGGYQWLDKMTDPEFGQAGYNMPGGMVARPTVLGSIESETPGPYVLGVARPVTDYSPERSQSCTAACVWLRRLGGEKAETSEMILKGIGLVRERPPRWAPKQYEVDLCYWHWGALAMEGVAESKRHYTGWRAALEDALLKNQLEDGSWPAVGVWSQGAGSVFATAMAALALLAPQAYGPDFFAGSWRKRHAGAHQALARALRSRDPRIRRAALPFADLAG